MVHPIGKALWLFQHRDIGSDIGSDIGRDIGSDIGTNLAGTKHVQPNLCGLHLAVLIWISRERKLQRYQRISGHHASCLGENLRCTLKAHELRNLLNVLLRLRQHVFVAQKHHVLRVCLRRLPPFEDMVKPRPVLAPASAIQHHHHPRHQNQHQHQHQQQ